MLVAPLERFFSSPGLAADLEFGLGRRTSQVLIRGRLGGRRGLEMVGEANMLQRNGGTS